MSSRGVVESNVPSAGSLETKLALRLAGVAFVAVFLQVSFFAGIRLTGGHADILPLVALACGLLTGTLPGAFTGFGMGLMADALVGVPLGLTSLTLVLIGGLGGLIADRRDPEGYLVPAVVGAVVTFGGLIFFAVVQLLLGSGSEGASWGLLSQIISTSLINGLIAPFVYALVRRVLVGALSRDPRRRRRRATTTKLSPLSSSRGQRNRRSRAAAARGQQRRGGTLGNSPGSRSGRRR